MRYCVYTLHSKKLDRFCTGYTSDFDTRLGFLHKAESRKYTYRASDWTLFLKMDCVSKKQALDVESHIKRMNSKKYIQNLKQYSEMRKTKPFYYIALAYFPDLLVINLLADKL